MFVRGQPVLHPFLDFALQIGGRAHAVLQQDKGFDDLCTVRVGFADDARHPDRGVADQTVLDLAGPDPVTG